jgi:predicted DNA-binding protein (MmcQ/YjbR family)
MTKIDPALKRMREICLSLPNTKETPTWGKPHFRVGDKIFAGCGEESGRQVLGFKLEMAHARAVVKDPRFWPAPYVGHKGWVSMDASRVEDWEEVRQMVLESYRLIAPKRTLALLETGMVRGRPKTASTATKTRKKTPAKPAPRKTQRRR